MRQIFFCLSFLFSLFLRAQTSIVLQENFTNYQGNASTAPAGWYFSYHGNYTSASFSGTSGPNSYQFGTNNATVITPAFSNADLLRFWLKGAGTDANSYLTVYETSDSISWDTLTVIKPIPTSGITLSFPLNNSATHLKFVFSKSVGNTAFDDFFLMGGKIIAYFNSPVNTSAATSLPAIYLYKQLDDILISYIQRARYSIDAAMYQYIQDTTIADIAAAINSAYNRGVRVRWIYDESTNNNSLLLLNGNIPKLGSPTGGAYGLMHNKFFIFDAGSPNSNDAIVWTGSCNLTPYQLNRDVNNVLVIRDSAVAQAYLTEFNEMWGDTGLLPNPANSKFGPYKTDNTPHLFNVGGVQAEVYFSPSDGTISHILQSVTDANKDLYFGMYQFASDVIADSIKNKIQNENVYAAGIVDNQSQQFSAYNILSAAMGNMLQVQNLTSIYHNKFLIADACDSLSDPLALSGSPNWSVSADTKNDENMVIIHDKIITNIYYQSFEQNFSDLGGTLSPCSTLAVNELPEEDEIMVFPNPASGEFQIQLTTNSWQLASSQKQEASIEIYNVFGEKVYQSAIQPFNHSTIDISSLPSGIYFLFAKWTNPSSGGKIKTEKEVFIKKLIIISS